MTPPQGVAAARANAVAARQRLVGTASTLKERLSPGTLASTVVERVRGGADAVMQDSITVAKRRPGTVAAGVGGVLLLLLGSRLLRRRRDGRTAPPPQPTAPPPPPAPQDPPAAAPSRGPAA